VPLNNTYSITGNVATGTKSTNVTSIYGTINVTFPLPVTEVFVEWTVDRTPVRKHYSSLLIGDMSFESGIFYEVHKYARNFDLPLYFVVEDNGVSTYTPTEATWNKKRNQPIRSLHSHHG
jgi:hypothetical protein